MGVLDKALEFSDAQALSIGSGAAIKSTKVRDLTGKQDSLAFKNAWGTTITPDIGEAGGLEWTVQVATTVVGAGTLSAALVSKAADASISSGGTTHHTFSFGVTAAAGTRKSVKVPPGTLNNYVGCLYTSTGGTTTAGALDSFLSLDHEKID